MNFLVDRCAGRRLTQWLQGQGHDALDARELGPDPGDRALLERAVSENRTLITMDTATATMTTNKQSRRPVCGRGALLRPPGAAVRRHPGRL